MHNDTTRLHIDYTDGAPLAADDPRGAMARSVQAARAVVGEVSDANAANATPCPDWTALELAQHIIAVLDRVAAGPVGDDVMAMPILADVAVTGLDAALDASIRRVHANWTSDDTMTALIDVPFGTFPGAQLIGIYAGEVLVHCWDLAVAIGVALNWPDADLARHYEGSKLGIPEVQRDETIPFGPVVRPGDDAPMIEHLVGWQGRDVGRWRVNA